VCPGFKQRINEIIYGQLPDQDGQEIAKDTNAKRENKKKNDNKTPS
jgi:hypothetical protein